MKNEIMHLLIRSIYDGRHPSLKTFGSLYFSMRQFADTMAAPEKEKVIPLDNDLIATSIAQSHTVPTADTNMKSPETMPLLDTANPELTTSRSLEIPTIGVMPVHAHTDMTPLPFEDIPGPTILKLWEKYWRYVPLLGTQLFCSLLINTLTQGRLSWNRNITPMKYLFNKYGCVVRINGPLVNNIVMIHKPEHIAEVFEQESELPVRSSIDILQHYRLNHRKYRFGGAFSQHSAEWLETRGKVEQPLDQTVSNYFGKIDALCSEFVNRIRSIRNRQDEVPATFHQDLTAWGMGCFYTIMFNKPLNFAALNSTSTSESAKILNALISAHTYMSRCETGFQVWRFIETSFVKKLFAACDVLDEIIGKYIRQTQNKLQNLSLLKNEKSINTEESAPLLERMILQRIHSDDISTLLMDMIVLGVQAAVNCEAFLLYFLAKNPRAQKRLYDEIRSVLSKTESTLTKEKLKDMPYLKACLRESLRLRPAFPYLTRLLSSAVTLHGYTIPKGTLIIMANQISSQREELFEDPEKYRPERWLNKNENEHNAHRKYIHLPFGYGVRSCLGKDMAETQMMLLTVKLVQEFTIEYDYADIQSRFLMVNIPNKPLRFRFVDRS